MTAPDPFIFPTSAAPPADAHRETGSSLAIDVLRHAAHDLRGPLNSLAGWVSLLDRESSPAEIGARSTVAMQRAIRLQSRFVDELEGLAELLEGGCPQVTEEIVLAALVDATIADLEVISSPREITVVSDLPNQLRLKSVPSLLRGLLWWLLYPLLQRTPNGGRILVAAFIADNSVALSLRNPGEGRRVGTDANVWDRVAADLCAKLEARLEASNEVVGEVITVRLPVHRA